MNCRNALETILNLLFSIRNLKSEIRNLSPEDAQIRGRSTRCVNYPGWLRGSKRSRG